MTGDVIPVVIGCCSAVRPSEGRHASGGKEASDRGFESNEQAIDVVSQK